MSVNLNDGASNLAQAVELLKAAVNDQKAEGNRVRAGRLLAEIDQLEAMRRRLQKIQRQIDNQNSSTEVPSAPSTVPEDYMGGDDGPWSVA